MYHDEDITDSRTCSELEGWAYRGPFDDHAPVAGDGHRVVRWDEVTMDQGTGDGHIAPGCGGEDFDLGKREGLGIIMPVDESGRFYPQFGRLAGKDAGEAAKIGRAHV